MAGSHHSKSRSSTRLFLVLLAALSLFAASCGSEATDTASDQVDAVEDAVEETTSDEPEAVAVDDDAASTDGGEPADEVASTDDTVDGVVTDAADAVEEPVDDTVASADDQAADTVVDSDSPLAQVLSFAAENSTNQSYSFSQGMAMRMNIAGQQFNIAPEDAYVFGEVENGATHIDMNMGVILGATFEATGLDVSDPAFAEVFSAFDDATIEMWSDENTLVMDMSAFAGAMGGLDPAAANEFALFADGPVSIDLTQVDDIDAAQLANQMGQGAQVTDPKEILEAIRSVDSVTEAGTDQVNGVDVQVFNANLTMPQYFEALGQDFNEQLGAANLGELGGDSDAAAAEAALEALNEVEVGLIVMVDGDDLVRRMEIGLDMGAMLEAMFSNPDFLEVLAAEEGQTVEELQTEMDQVLGGGLEMRIDTWQEFDNYGDSFGITFPDAVDVTDQVDQLDLAS